MEAKPKPERSKVLRQTPEKELINNMKWDLLKNITQTSEQQSEYDK